MPPLQDRTEEMAGKWQMSFGVDDLDQAIGELAKRGTEAGDIRAGLSNWHVADLDTESRLGIKCHLTQVRQR